MNSFNDRTSIHDVASPMSNLANCLGTKLSVRRRLTLSESGETSKKCYENIIHGTKIYLNILVFYKLSLLSV